jgi:hypothetical protein
MALLEDSEDGEDTKDAEGKRIPEADYLAEGSSIHSRCL